MIADAKCLPRSNFMQMTVVCAEHFSVSVNFNCKDSLSSMRVNMLKAGMINKRARGH